MKGNTMDNENVYGAGYEAPNEETTQDASSLFDELLEDAEVDLGKVIHLQVEMRPKYSLRFNAVIGYKDIERYRRAGQGNSKKADKIDAIKSNALPILEKCTGIFKGGPNGEQITLGDGGELKLTSKEFLDMNKSPNDAIASLQRFLGDAGLITMGAALLEAAGWTSDLEPMDAPENPTDG